MSKAKTTTKAKREPKPTSTRLRPNKTFIQQMVAFRGNMTGDEKTQLATLEVKNALQRVNNRAMTEGFSGVDNAELQRLMKEFVKGVNEVLASK